jgi:hypothetical protein
MKKILVVSAIILTTSLASFAQSTKKQSTKSASATSAPAPLSKTEKEMIGGDGMAGMMSAMGPMLTTMATSMMDAQLAYYKQPGKLEEIAKLQKQYFDALVKEGFANDQALKIITSDSLLPKASNVK